MKFSLSWFLCGKKDAKDTKRGDLCGKKDGKDAKRGDQYVFPVFNDEENLRRRDQAIIEIEQMFCHEHKYEWECIDADYFNSLKESFKYLMRDLDTHEEGGFK